MQLLTQLEDSYWECCAARQKLHPLKESILLQFWFPTKKKCITWAGLVDLCPCITLTPRDRKHIMEYLTEAAIDQQRANLTSKEIWTGFDGEKSEQGLLHKYKGYSTARTDIMLILTPSRNLIVATQYQIPCLAWKKRSLYVCPHTDLWDHIPGMFHPGTARDYISCHANVVNLLLFWNQEVIVASVARYLGRKSLPRTDD